MAITPFAKLVVVLILALIDIVNYIWGVDLIGVRNEQALGIIVTLLLAAAGLLGLQVPSAGGGGRA